MNDLIQNAEQIFTQLPVIQKEKIHSTESFHKIRGQKVEAIIVLDDDPTGTQTVYDVPVLTDWSAEVIEQELALGSPIFYLLTNSRSLPQSVANDLALTIGKNIRQANTKHKKKIMVISRGDSTLRGHYPSEVETLAIGLNRTNFVNIFIPAFFEGGRFTVKNIHYVKQEDRLIPAAQTPYAKDKVFAYTHSNLKEWIGEKTKGAVHPSEVVSFSIQELRTQNLSYLIEKLNHCKPHTTCIVNATSYFDLQVFALALMQSTLQYILRTAASFVAAVAALPHQSFLKKPNLIQQNLSNGGLIIVGSHVPKTTRQLQHLHQNLPLNSIELDVQTLLDTNKKVDFLLQEYSTQINDLIHAGKDVVLYTSRTLISANTAENNLAISVKISNFLTTIVHNLSCTPKYIITKGGITSSDIATKALGVKRAMVQGQILAGIPVWKLGAESKYPNISYIIFPGNVGNDDAITKVVKELE